MASLLNKEIQQLSSEKYFDVDLIQERARFSLKDKEKLEILKYQDRRVSEIADYSHENKILFILDNDIEIVNSTLIISSHYYLYKINLESNLSFSFESYSGSIIVKTANEEFKIKLRAEVEEEFVYKDNRYITEISVEQCSILFIKLLKIMLKKYYSGVYPQL